MKKSIILAIAACAAVAVASPRPRPSAAQLARIESEFELYGIVHWGLNTYTNREWGFGNEDPSLLDADSFDAGQIVRAARAGGLQGLVVVAKHHDGFCLWPTKTTGYNISKSPFRDGKGDYVREMSEACRKYGLKFGVYVSPWDRNSAHYSTPQYVEIFHRQIRELLDGSYGEIFEMWFDNANGGDGWYGGAKGKRSISPGYYRFGEVFRFVRKMQPSVCIFNEDDAADFRWPGNEKGILDENCRASGSHFDISKYSDYLKWAHKGVKDGVCFHPLEADFPLRPGWFYHESQKGRTKPAAYLLQRYLNTVGNGGTMNIGIAPDRRGLVCDEDVRALEGFGCLLNAFFSRPVETGLCNVVVMREDVSNGEQIDGWSLEADGETLVSGESIGIKRIRILPRKTEVGKLRLRTAGCAGGAGRMSSVRHYLVDERLLAVVAEASCDSVETDTALWMNAARQPETSASALPQRAPAER